MILGALDSTDDRSFSVAVAGTAALLVSKVHKISERLAEREQRRLDDKDALDVLRLLQATQTSDLVRSFRRLLEHAVARDVTLEGLRALDDLFSHAQSPGSQMAARAAGPLAVPGQIAASCAILATDLLKAMSRT
jgi:hypothetical protein